MRPFPDAMTAFSDFPELKGCMFASRLLRDEAEEKVLKQREEAAARQAAADAEAAAAAAEKKARAEANRKQREANAARLLQRAAARAQEVDGDAEHLATQLGEKTKLSQAKAEQAKQEIELAKQRRIYAAEQAAKEKAVRDKELSDPPPFQPSEPARELTLMEKMAAARKEQEVAAEKRWLKSQVRSFRL